LAGASFASNFYFWSRTGYFDGGADTKPLLHLWSLAIEEQFYLIWPLCLYVAMRFKARMAVLLVLICIASFALNIALVTDHQAAAFYSPLSRFWELMIGAILAWAMRTLPHESTWLAKPDLRSAIGVLLLLAGFGLINEHSPFPGWYALLPVCGSALLISAPGALFNRRLLGSMPMRSIGLISYPLYLWHWPALYLVRYFDVWHFAGEHGARWIAIGLSVVLSWLTYRVIERPVRFGALKAVATRPLSAFMVAIMSVGALVLATDGFASRDKGELSRLERFAGKYPAAEWRDRRCFLNPTEGPEAFADECAGSKAKPATTSPLLFLWGDSYAAALYPGLRALEDQGMLRVAQYTASACAPLLDSTFPAQAHCNDVNRAALRKMTALRPDTVLLTARWPYAALEPGYDFKHLASTIAAIKSAGIRHVIVVGPTPQWEKPMPLLLSRCADKEAAEDGSFFSHCGNAPDTVTLDQAMRDFAMEFRVSYLSPLDELCSATGCAMVIDGTAVTTYDMGHLSPEASRFVMKRFASRLFLN